MLHSAPSAHPLHAHGPLSLSQRRPPCLFQPFSPFPPTPHPSLPLLSQTFSPLAAVSQQPPPPRAPSLRLLGPCNLGRSIRAFLQLLPRRILRELRLIKGRRQGRGATPWTTRCEVLSQINYLSLSLSRSLSVSLALSRPITHPTASCPPGPSRCALTAIEFPHVPHEIPPNPPPPPPPFPVPILDQTHTLTHRDSSASARASWEKYQRPKRAGVRRGVASMRAPGVTMGTLVRGRCWSAACSLSMAICSRCFCRSAS
jgi:hypothetical protein